MKNTNLKVDFNHDIWVRVEGGNSTCTIEGGKFYMYPTCASRACVGWGGLGGNYFAWVAPIKGNLVALLFGGLIEGLMATF